MAVNINGIHKADGLTRELADTVERLKRTYMANASHNVLVRNYYDGNVVVDDFGVKVSASNLENDQTCHWPSTAVDKLADRIVLDKFVTRDEPLSGVIADNHVVGAYNRHLTDKLTHGCMFATVGMGPGGRPQVRFHSAESATALPDPDGATEDGYVGAGLAVARMETTEWSRTRPVPTLVNVYTPGGITVIRKVSSSRWEAGETMPVPEARPMMLAFTHRPSGRQPLGRTRISKFVRTLTDDAIRCLWRMQVSSAYYSMPKEALLGLTEEQYNAMMQKPDKGYYDLRLLATRDDDGNVPQLVRLNGNSPQPYIDELRALGCLFSGATGVPLISLGIVSDNPSSAEAIAAAREDISLVAERDISQDREVLKTLCHMALAVAENTTIAGLTDEQRAVVPHFKEPTRSSKAAMGDWALKMAQARPSFAESDVFLDAAGVEEADQERIKSDERRAAAAAMANKIFGNAE